MADTASASIYRLKPAFQRVLRPTAARLAAAGVTPNMATVAGFAAAAASGTVVGTLGTTRWILAVPVLYLVRMGLNAIDGVLAREHGSPTEHGRLLNELGDVAGDAAAYVPFVAVIPGPVPQVLLMAAVVGGILAEVTSLVVAAAGSRPNDGPYGKSDRALLFGLLAFAAGSSGTVVIGVLLFMLVLSAVTIRNRARHLPGRRAS
jgi:CDP-diacylglycerol--glycerol-3-phosphate 3-phosphatidyltransferase